jgi:hypothetical protein
VKSWLSSLHLRTSKMGEQSKAWFYLTREQEFPSCLRLLQRDRNIDELAFALDLQHKGNSRRTGF